MSKPPIDYLYVGLILVMSAGLMYNIDWPQALSTKLQVQPYSLSLQEVNLFYTVAYGVCLVCSFPLGMLLDKIPLKISLIAIPCLVLSSQLGTALAFSFQYPYRYYVVMIFRVCFVQFGGCSFIILRVALGKLLKKNASKVSGFAEVMGGLFESFNSLMSPILFDVFGRVTLPLFFGVGICLIPLSCNIYLVRDIVKKEKQKTESDSQLEPAEKTKQIQPKKPNIGVIQQLKSFNSSFWTIQALIFGTFVITNVFISVATDLIVKRFNVYYPTAGKLVMIPYAISALTSFLGMKLITTNPTIRRSLYILISSFALMAQIGLYFLPNTTDPNLLHFIVIPIVLFLVGLCCCGLTIVICPSIFLIAKEEQLGAAFGFVEICISSSYIIAPLIFSKIYGLYADPAQGYRTASLVFVGFSAFCFLISLLLKCSSRFEAFDADIYKKMSEIILQNEQPDPAAQPTKQQLIPTD